MKIGLDLMGGDFAPLSVLEGCRLASKEIAAEDKVLLFGNSSLLNEAERLLLKELLKSGKFNLIDTPEVIQMAESPTKAIQAKPDSSIVVGSKYLANDKIDVFLGAGNSGAMLVAALYTVKAIEGIIRPVILTVVPQISGKIAILLDVGINPDCRQDVLAQFGILGSIYMKFVHKIENPRIGLLNIGEEKEKGNLVTQAAYALLENEAGINFIGNVEGYDIFNEKADVIVCDGFTGNIVLKTCESFYHILKQRGINDDYFNSFNYEIYGGTPILGINKPVILGHGVSNDKAFLNMIHLGKKVVETNLVHEIKKLVRSQI